MKIKELEVGQSFDVVEVLSKGGYGNLMKIGGFTINLNEGDILTNGSNPALINKDKNLYNQHVAYMFDHEIKKVGKLTITKLK